MSHCNSQAAAYDVISDRASKGTIRQTIELIDEMLRHRYAVNNAGSTVRGFKIQRNLRREKGLGFSTEAFCCR